MEILNIKYSGNGSDAQINYATSIFNAEIKEINDMLETAKIRVSDKSMPERWVDTWVNVLNNPKAITLIERFASQSASETIGNKGFKTKKGAVRLSAWFEKMVIQEYSADQA